MHVTFFIVLTYT